MVVGPLLLLDHLFALLAAITILALSTALGLALLRIGRLKAAGGIELLVFAVAIGGGALSLMNLMLGAVAGVNAPVFLAGFLAVSAIAHREIAMLPGISRDAWREFTDTAGGPVTLVLITIGAGMLLLAVAPPTDTDSLNYHIRVPAQFISRGRIHVPEDNLHVAWIGLAHFLWLPLLTFGAWSGPAVGSVLLAVLLVFAVSSAAARLLSSKAGRFAPLVLLGSAMLLLVSITPKIDGALAMYLFLAQYALLRADDTSGSVGPWLTTAAILLGLAVGIKLLALPFLLSLTPVLLFMSTRWPRGARVRRLALFGLVVAISAMPWLVKNQVLVGAPFYPRLAAPRVPPWVEGVYAQAGLPSSAPSTTVRALATVRDPFNLVDWFLTPERLTPESEGRYYGANPLFLVLIPGLLLLRRRPFAMLLGAAVLYIGIVVLLAPRLNLRYLVPIIPALAICSAEVIAVGLQGVRPKLMRLALVGIVAILALHGTARALERKISERPALRHAAGLLSRRDYRLLSRDVEIEPYARMTTHMNTVLPGDARVLLLFEARGHGFTARVIQDNSLANWMLLQPAVGPPRCLDGTGITHVLVGVSTLRYFVSRGFDPKIIGWDKFPQFAERCLVLVDAQSDALLYRVKDGA